jgi:hypothetical protein
MLDSPDCIYRHSEKTLWQVQALPHIALTADTPRLLTPQAAAQHSVTATEVLTQEITLRCFVDSRVRNLNMCSVGKCVRFSPVLEGQGWYLI